MSTTRFTAVTLLMCILTGCATSGSSWPSFANRDDGHRESRRARKGLKDPAKLDLAYAKLQEQFGNMTEARERYQRVLHDEPQSVDALLGLARLDQLAGRMQEAEQGFRKAQKIAPNDPNVMDAIGQFYVAQNKFPQAIDILKQALQTAPADETVRFHLAVAMAKSGDISGARPLFVNAVGEAEADYNIGVILHDQGKLEQAEPFFVQAIVKKPTLDQAQYWLNEIRVEKETKQLLAGTNGRPRPELQAPAGASTKAPEVYSVEVQEQRLSPQEVMRIQQTAGQQRLTNGAGSYANHSVAPAVGNVSTQAAPQTSRPNGPQNPFATGNPWQSQGIGAGPAGQNGLTPQQLEQLRNQN